MTEKCESCRFWQVDPKGLTTDAEDRDGEFEGMGWCRRFPPKISEHMAGMAIGHVGFGGHDCDPEDIADSTSVHRACLRPAVWHSDWCGEWSAGAPGTSSTQQWESPC